MQALLLLLACRPSFTTVDAACHDEVKGDRHASSLAVEFQRRVDCHRRVAGLDRVALDDAIGRAAAAHAAYMDEVDLATNLEDRTVPGYTGTTVVDRLLAAGFDEATDPSIALWEVFGDRGALSPEEVVDEGLVASLFLREPLLVSTAWAAGYGDHAGWLDYVLVMDFPADAHLDRPVAYPADGQADVPTSFYAVEPVSTADPDWLPFAELRGFPLTLTFGGTQVSSDWTSGLNVYDVQVQQVRLDGPDGRVAVDWAQPGDGHTVLAFSVAVIPVEPLSTSTQYHLQAEGTRGDDSWAVDLHFSTRMDDTPANQALLESAGFDMAPVSLGLRAGPLASWR